MKVKKEGTIMTTSMLIAIILFVIVLAGIFSYRINATYYSIGSIIAAIAALLLFLIAINAIHL
jgi:hypothetical protein